jgi:hypothetical protein
MRWFGFLSAVVLLSQWIPRSRAAPPEDEQRRAPAAMSSVSLPPVLRKFEPHDNVVVMLPGPARTEATVRAEPPALPATEVRLAPPPPDPDRPLLRRPKHDYPADFERDSADFLQRQIGVWNEVDAEALLGEPLRQRPAYNDDQTVNGRILAFDDPTGRYRELELDLDGDSGLMRTLFVYPFSMTWQECRRAFGGNAKPAQANKGRTFYSYLDRRLDVLVDTSGKVISLGLY